MLFSTHVPGIHSPIHFRSLDLQKDCSLIHSWVTQPYVARFWQLKVGLPELTRIYTELLASPLAHSFIGLLESEVVCQIDLYHVSAEEIAAHVPDDPGACGLHILLCPPRASRKGLATAMLKAFIAF